MTSSCGSSGRAVHEAALALGSNMGDSAAILQGALDDVASVDGITVIAVSPTYETDPVGGPEQKAYLNAVAVVLTDLDPWALLAVTQSIEQHWHRTREVRWGPRTLDIDILAIDDATVDSEDLVVPHPRAHERGFVLVPWADVAPDAVIVGHGRVGDLRDSVDTSGVRPASTVLRFAEYGDFS